MGVDGYSRLINPASFICSYCSKMHLLGDVSLEIVALTSRSRNGRDLKAATEQQTTEMAPQLRLLFRHNLGPYPILVAMVF